MINENKEITINTAEGFEIIRLVNKMGIKQKLIDVINKTIEVDQLKQENLKKLQKLIIEEVGGIEEYSNLLDDDKAKITNELLIKHEEIGNSLSRIESDLNFSAIELFYEFISKSSVAEKEFYKTLGKIINKSPKDLEIQELNETVEDLKEIIKCKTFKKLVYFFK